MDKTAFWQQKLVQLLHDPPAKPYYRYGSSDWFKGLVEKTLGEEQAGKLFGRKSLRGHKVSQAPCSRPTSPIITHPLAPGYRLHTGGPASGDAPKARETARGLLQAQLEIPGGDLLGHPNWQEPEDLQVAFVLLWRRFRDELVARRGAAGGVPGSDPLWEEMPADSRCPDHSIWDHLRVTTALAFLRPHRMKEKAWLDNRWGEGPQQPWLLRYSIGPVQTFISEARTSRDLWTGSMLLAELAWAAMGPFVERYGPDCILYPDLRANPRVDTWLFEAYPDALRPGANPSSFAALLPNAFVALVPRGGEGELLGLEALAQEAGERVTTRWHELATKVRQWLLDNTETDAWGPIWERQLEEPPLYRIWTAVPWLPPGCISDPASLLQRALPVQAEGFREARDSATAGDRLVAAARRDRLRPWVPAEAWSLYERTRHTYASCNLDFHQMERGFDYALTHHQLSTRHALRKQSYPRLAGELRDEHGEKCTLCGKRQALTDAADDGQGLDHLRRQAQELWSHRALDPDQTGADRLCGVCALKR
jgi:CRISPR-associated protein Cmr2